MDADMPINSSFDRKPGSQQNVNGMQNNVKLEKKTPQPFRESRAMGRNASETEAVSAVQPFNRSA